MSATDFVGKRKSRSRATSCHSPAAILAAALGAVTLGVANPASAHRTPPTCNKNISGAAIGFVAVTRCVGGANLGQPCDSDADCPDSTCSPIRHGDEICFQVGIFNTCIGCCDVTELDTELVMPDGSIVPITVNGTVLWNDSFPCPGDLKACSADADNANDACTMDADCPGGSCDAKCATASNCTIPGETGYRYIVDHGDEHGATGTNCPPTPAAGTGEVSAFFRSTEGTAHLWGHIGVNLCQAMEVEVSPGCCEAGCDPPPKIETVCTDGLDNDCDTLPDCADADCAVDAVACPIGQIPTVSEWGMVVMALLFTMAGTVVLRRGRAESNRL